MINLAKNSLLILCLIVLSSCVKHYHIHPVVQPEVVQEEPEEWKGKDLGRYKFDLTEKERALNKDNEFLRYLETGKGGYRAVTRTPIKDRPVSDKQRKAVRK